jgi:uncharacterized protein (TIGR03437 family)
MLLIRALALCAWTGVAIAATAPVLTYSTYLRDAFVPNAIATDSSGNIYLAGSAVIDPATQGKAGFVVKLNPQSGQYIYQSFLNGQANQIVNAIAVDESGNAYVAGTNANSGGMEQSFVAKLNSNGDLLFSTPIGGSTESQALAIALTAGGQILVSGMSVGSAFPSTPGAYSVPNTADRPYLVEFDPTGTKTIFSATGIGGNAITLDPAGNIYVAGSTVQLDYPTTPGAYQITFPAFNVCSFLCQIGYQGANQYVTKVDPSGSTLIYSTALTGNGVTNNVGLAVDAAGDAYVTGYAGAGYPYTVTPPSTGPVPVDDAGGETIAALPFVSKLDPAGQKLLFSVPVGGGGVQVDSSGAVYVGGGIGSSPLPDFPMTANLPALSGVPSGCLPNQLLITNSAYVAQIDGASGNLVNTQFIGGDTLTISSVALAGSVLWAAGATNDPGVPYTPNALTLTFADLPNVAGPGAYLAAVDFSQPQPPAGTPQISCVLDGGDLAAVGPAARLQLLTILGSGLGPATGVSSSNNSTTTLAGVQVSFGGTPAPLLYVSSNQINLAVPALEPNSTTFSPLQVAVAGAVSSSRALPITHADPNLFLNYTLSLPVTNSSPGFVAFALNADGSLNSPANPAQLASTISVFVNGLVANPDVNNAPLQISAIGGWTVASFEQVTPFVFDVKLQTPSALNAETSSFSCPPNQAPLCTVGFALYYGEGGPPQVPINSGTMTSAVVYVSR